MSDAPMKEPRVWIASKGTEKSLRLSEADGWEVHEVAKAPAHRPNSPEDIRQSMDLLQQIHRESLPSNGRVTSAIMELATLRGALDFIQSLAEEELPFANVGSGHEVALRHIERRAREALAAPRADADHEFKNFHRLLCERFGYGHDDVDWKRDQLSLIEWIAKRLPGETPAPASKQYNYWTHSEMVTELGRLRAALTSIADNTCCTPCQEAANVARTTLGRPLLHIQPVETNSPQAPIANVCVDEEGRVAYGHLYAPGLPPGEHDLYCEPPAPGGEKVPHPAFETSGCQHDLLKPDTTIEVIDKWKAKCKECIEFFDLPGRPEKTEQPRSVAKANAAYAAQVAAEKATRCHCGRYSWVPDCIRIEGADKTKHYIDKVCTTENGRESQS